MKIEIKSGGKKFTVNFLVIPSTTKDVHLSAMARTSKDLDIIQSAIEAGRGNNDLSDVQNMIGLIIAKAVSKKLKLPVKPKSNYDGAGYGLEFDLYSIAKSLK
jgi:hypothetical protein|tara:strand:- start:126 stop:434 length:309 start_codon:yes stop_codon:yes gene_type:complete